MSLSPRSPASEHSPSPRGHAINLAARLLALSLVARPYHVAAMSDANSHNGRASALTAGSVTAVALLVQIRDGGDDGGGGFASVEEPHRYMRSH